MFAMLTSPITALITRGALCLECIADKTGMEQHAAEQAVKELSYSVPVDHYLNGTCVRCRKSALVYAIDRPPR